MKNTLSHSGEEIKDLQDENVQLKLENDKFSHEFEKNSTDLRCKIKELEGRNDYLIIEHEAREDELRNCVWQLEAKISDLEECIDGRSKEIRDILEFDDKLVENSNDNYNANWTSLINKLRCYLIEIREECKKSNLKLITQKDTEVDELKNRITYYEDFNSKFKLQQEISEQELTELKGKIYFLLLLL